MAQENVGININVQGNAVESIGNVKKALKEANAELINAQSNFGDYSQEAIAAAKRVAELKDKISEARETADLFDPGKKFQVFAGAINAVAGGFTAVQGALGVVGAESEDLQKSLLKVQSALALTQGLSTVTDSVKDFQRLGVVVKTQVVSAFNSLKGAIGSTGIGALVLALGAIVTYWDDIKEAVSGVSDEQKKLLTDTQADAKAQQEKLSTIDSQDNILKLQGKSERDILGIKIKQTEQVIVATEKQVAQQKIVLQAQLAAEKRNKEILKGILTFVTAPLQLVIDGVNQVAKVFGKGFEFNVAEKLSGLVFDPKATEANGQKEIAALDKTLNDLKNKKAGYQLAVQNIDKQGASKSASDAERLRKEREAAEKEAQTILAEANKKLKTQQEQDLLNITEAYAEKQKKLALAGIKDNGDLAAAEQKERQAVLDKYAKEAKDLKDKNDKEAKDKEIAFQTELNKITLETKLAGIKDEGEKARVELEANFKKQREDIDANEKFTAEQKAALKIELAKKEALALDALRLAEDKKIADSELAALDKRLADNETDLQIERSLLDQKDTLLKDAFAKKLITEEEYNKGVEANAKARIEIDKKEAETKVQLLQMTSQALTQAADILGKETAAGKTLAVAGALINTYQGIAAGVKLGFPLAIPAVAMAAATGFGAVKNILAVKTPGGSGASSAGNMSAPNVSAMAPIAPPQPQAATTNISSQSINALGNQAIRSYVVESDVTSNQQRIAAIQQRARFG